MYSRNWNGMLSGRTVRLIPSLLLSTLTLTTSGCSPNETDNKPAPTSEYTQIDLESQEQLAWNLVFDYPSDFGDEVEEWVALIEGGNDGEFYLEEDGRHKGSGALAVRIDQLHSESTWDIQAYLEQIPVRANSVHYFSIWIKGPRGGEARASVESEDYRTFVTRSIVLTGSWQNVAMDFIPDTPYVRTPVHLGFPHNEGETIYLDQAELSLANSEFNSNAN